MSPTIITIAWLLAVSFGMILRSVATPPGRPDDVDHALIIAAPIICASLALVSRSPIWIWCCIIPTLLGCWCAWENNTRLPLAIAYRGYAPQLQWWSLVVGWTMIGSRSAASLVWWLRDVRRRQPMFLGLCPACGYDLRATPERCPECGFQPMPAGGQQ